MLIPSYGYGCVLGLSSLSRRVNANSQRNQRDEGVTDTSLSRRVNANSQLAHVRRFDVSKLIKKGEC